MLQLCSLLVGFTETTLLDIVAGRKAANASHSRTEGAVVFSDSAAAVAYVMQDNVHIASLTVRQTLEYAGETLELFEN